MKKDLTYSQEFNALLLQIKQAKQQAFAQVNNILIELYWQIGKTISHKVQSTAWGKSVVSEFAKFISDNDPEIKGFSDKNLWRMKQFYETYQDDEKLSALARELSWTNNAIIFSRCKTAEEREFYLKLSIDNKLAKRDLERQIDVSTFERTKLNNSILSPLARELYPTLENVFKNNYVLEFLGLPEDHNESDLQKALIQNMKSFILELGKDFIFVSEEFRLQVGNQDFFIDLLFYHRGLSALVAFELKIGKFLPEHMGQLNFYLEALDRDVKKPHENPSIGILLCRDKDHEVVEYAMSRNLSPTLIAEYQLQLPDKKLLQAKLHEIFINNGGENESS